MSTMLTIELGLVITIVIAIFSAGGAYAIIVLTNKNTDRKTTQLSDDFIKLSDNIVLKEDFNKFSHTIVLKLDKLTDKISVMEVQHGRVDQRLTFMEKMMEKMTETGFKGREREGAQ